MSINNLFAAGGGDVAPAGTFGVTLVLIVERVVFGCGLTNDSTGVVRDVLNFTGSTIWWRF